MIDQRGEEVGSASGDDLLSLASHELRTTLSIVKWYTEMLLEGDCGPLNDDQIKYLKTVEGSNQRAIDLIRSLLNVSRLNLGTFSINPTVVDLRKVVKDVLDQNKAKIDEKKLRVSEEYMNGISGTVPTLPLDKQIAFVLMRSLISNAIIFSKEGSEIKITLKEAKQHEMVSGLEIPEDSLVVSVQDSGIGIPKSEQEKIFSKLFKASNARSYDENGSGLSLYIVRSILSKTGGASWFTSLENVGTTFYIAFPKAGMSKKSGKVNLD
jgi:two-component system, OmpR family, phosphate regulon sensor histidine kinase PhoR